MRTQRSRAGVIAGQVFGLLLAAALPACGRTGLSAPSDCPCAPGWQCCAGENVCVRAASDCPSAVRDDMRAASDDRARPSEIPGQHAAPSPSGDDATAGRGATRDQAGSGGSRSSAGRRPRDTPDAAPELPDAGTPERPIRRPECLTGHWCWMTPEPTGDDYMGMWGSAPDDVWLATGSGTIVHYDGSRFETRYQYPHETWTGFVWGSAADDVWFVFNTLDQAAFVHWDGTRFAPDKAILGEDAPPLYAADASEESLWVVGAGATVLRLARGDGNLLGFSSSVPTGIPADRKLIAVCAIDDDHVFVLDDRGAAYQGNALLSTWAEIDPPAAAAAASTGLGLLAGSPDALTIFRYETRMDAGNYQRFMIARRFDGEAWTQTEGPDCGGGADAYLGPVSARHVWAAAPDDVWVTVDSHPCVSHWDGAAWSTMVVDGTTTPTLGQTSLTIWSDGEHTLAAGSYGNVWQLNRDEDAWENLVGPLPSSQAWLTRIAASSDDDIYAVAANTPTLDDIIHFDGERWETLPRITPVTYPPYAFPAELYAAGPDDLWAVGAMSPYLGDRWGFMAHWDGTSWQRTEVDEPVIAVWGSGPRDVWSATGSGVQHWNGKTWSEPTANPPCLSIVTASGDGILMSGRDPDDENECSGEFRYWLRDGVDSEPRLLPARDGTFRFAGGLLWRFDSWSLSVLDGDSWTEIVLPEDIVVEALWGERADDVWLVANHSVRAVVLHWDGVSLSRNLEAAIGRNPSAITGTATSLFIAGNGVLRASPR